MDFRHIIIIFSFLVCFALAPALAFIFGDRDKTKRVLIPFAIGFAVYLVSQKGIYAIFVKCFAVFTAYDPMIMGNKWIFGSYMCIGTSLIWEGCRATVLYLTNKYEKWSRQISYNLAFALGDCWAMGMFGWGIYIIQLIQLDFFDSEHDLDYFAVVSGDLIIELLERVIVGLLIVGISYIMEYGIVKKKATMYIPVAIIVRVIASLLMYFIPAGFHLPKLLAEIIVGALAVLMFLYGRLLLKSVKGKKYKKTKYI